MSIGSMSKLKNNQKKEDPKKLNPYSIDKLSHIHPGVKIGFMKFWVAGAAYFLTFTAFQSDALDLMVALYLLLILGVEYIVSKVILWMDNDRQRTLHYLPHHVTRKSVFSLLMTALYVLVMLMSGYFLIEWLLDLGVPSIGMLFFGFENKGNDPITFGLIFLLTDWIWLLIKNAIFMKHEVKKDA
ncbi:MAG: hypothetical protein RBR75_06880 [Acholeplasmataceae bacterium]|nr:hypothetical protein [Acholeplasmataceae bacterium]